MLNRCIPLVFRACPDGLQGASRSQSSQQGGELTGPILQSPVPLGQSLPHGGVTPSMSQVVSSSPFRSCRVCMECQHIPPALWFSPKPRSGRLARSSSYVVDGPGWAGGAEPIWAPSQVGPEEGLLWPSGVSLQGVAQLWPSSWGCGTMADCTEGT